MNIRHILSVMMVASLVASLGTSQGWSTAGQKKGFVKATKDSLGRTVRKATGRQNVKDYERQARKTDQRTENDTKLATAKQKSHDAKLKRLQSRAKTEK